MLLLAAMDAIYWMLILFVAVAGIIGLIIIRGLFLAWRRQERHFDQTRRSQRRQRRETPAVDTWQESARRLLDEPDAATEEDDAEEPMLEDFKLRQPDLGDDVLGPEDDEADDEDDDDDDDPYDLFRKPQ